MYSHQRTIRIVWTTRTRTIRIVWTARTRRMQSEMATNVTLKWVDNMDDKSLNSTISFTVANMIGTYFCVSGTVGFILNTIVVVTMIKHRNKANSTEMQILQLSAIDLMQVVLVFPAAGAFSFQHTIPHFNLCVFQAAVVFFCGCTSIWIITVMSLVRYRKICYVGTVVSSNTGPRLVWYFFTAVCIHSLIWSLSPLLGWGGYGREPFLLTCSLDWKHLNALYVHLIFGACFALPVFVIIFCYYNIVRAILQARWESRMIFNRLDSYLIKLVIGIVASFFVAWTPYAVIAYLHVYNYDVPMALSIMTPLLAKTGTVFNPVVYFLVIGRYRRDTFSCLSSLNIINKRKNRTTQVDYSLTDNCKQGNSAELVNLRHSPSTADSQANHMKKDSDYKQLKHDVGSQENFVSICVSDTEFIK